MERLEWFANKYIVNFTEEVLFDKLITYTNRYDKPFHDALLTFDRDYNLKILKEVKTRMKNLCDFKENSKFFYEEPKIDIALAMSEKMGITSKDTLKNAILVSIDLLKRKGSDYASVDEVKEVFIDAIAKLGLKNGQVLWPVRVALTGEPFSPGALELIYILGTKKSIARLDKFLKEI